MATSTISVVIPTWNLDRRAELTACLKAIARQTQIPDEVIVVVDHNPELADWAQENLEAVVVIPNRHQQGVVGSRNTGIEAATGEIVVFTDDDTVAEPDWIAELTACFDDVTVIGVTGELLPAWAGQEPRWFPSEFYWVFGCSYTGLPTETAPVRNPIGANMAVRRQTLAEIGGFQVGVQPRVLRHRGQVVAGGHALEDTDLGIRIGRAWPEKQWLYEPRATVHHNVDHEQATLGFLIRRSYEEGFGKAVLAKAVGAGDGLDSERRHLLVTVPRGVAAGFADLLRGDLQGPARSLALMAGVIAAGAGFLLGSLSASTVPDRS